MLKTMTWTAAFVAAWSLAVPATNVRAAQARTEAVAQTESTEEVAARPEAEYSEVVLVEESLPFVAESNTIATKLALELGRTPANVGIVDLELLTEQDNRILGDALENISGTNVHTGNGVFDFFVLRGFDSITSGLVLTDGAPEPEASFYQMYNTERVEVFKGPAGFLYGSNPLAGVVNLVRKQAVPADFGLVEVGFGSFGSAESRLDWNGSTDDGRLSFRLNGMLRESDGYRDGRESEVTAVNPTISWRPGERTALSVNFEVANADYTPDAGLPLLGSELPNVPRKRSYASPLDFSEQDITRFQVDFEHAFSDTLELRNKLYLRELDWQTTGTLLAGVFPIPLGPGAPELQVFRNLTTLDDEQRFVGNQFEMIWRPAGSRHELLAGVEVARLQDDFALDVFFLPFIGLESPLETTVADELVPVPGQATRGRSTADVVAPYLIDRFQASDRVLILAGARFDSIDFEDQATGTQRSHSEISPMLGLVFEPRQGTALYANVAESFAPPSPRVVGDREPEQSRQVEVGIRRQFLGGKLTSTLAAFRLERDNIAIPDDNGFTQQAGDQESQGLELELAGSFGGGGRAAFNYAYTDSELTRFREVVFGPDGRFLVLDRSGNASAFAPRHLANLWLSKPFRAFRVGGGLRWIDDQFIAEDNGAEIDGHLLVNGAVSYGRDRWRLALRLRNLTDEDYETRGFGSSAVIPGDPLSATLSFQVRLGG